MLGTSWAPVPLSLRFESWYLVSVSRFVNFLLQLEVVVKNLVVEILRSSGVATVDTKVKKGSSQLQSSPGCIRSRIRRVHFELLQWASIKCISEPLIEGPGNVPCSEIFFPKVMIIQTAGLVFVHDCGAILMEGLSGQMWPR